MSRESETYRDNLEQLTEFFGGKRVLSLSDVVRYTGRDRRTVKRLYQVVPSSGITTATLARRMSREA